MLDTITSEGIFSLLRKQNVQYFISQSDFRILHESKINVVSVVLLIVFDEMIASSFYDNSRLDERCIVTVFQ